MFNSVKYVLNENITNMYRIYSIAKYEIISENRDSKLGMIWNVLNPAIQIFTYWFAFGLGIRNGDDVDGINFFQWMIAGLVVWFFISPCITAGVNSIHKKNKIITKMKFPVSILPTMVVLKETFNHLCMLTIVYIILLFGGIRPHLTNLQIIYYIFCTILFSISLAMITSVLNMFTRDVKKIVQVSMRMLLYATPILWTMEKMPIILQNIMKYNPIYFVVNGYRNSLFYHKPLFTNLNEHLFFWGLVIVMFLVGSKLMYSFKHKFIDFI